MLVRPMARRLSSTGRLSCFTRLSLKQRSRSWKKHCSYFSTLNNNDDDNSLIVTGSGVAGCAAALMAAEHYQIPVKLLFAGNLPQDCNSYWAQGGIIYKNENSKVGDSPELLMQDIMRAGAGLCEPNAVFKVATEGPSIVEELLLNSTNHNFANVPFDVNDDGSLSCCLEASHAAPRIIHYADHTGKVITEHMVAAAHKHPLIELVPNTLVTDLILRNEQCIGVHVLNKLSNETSSLYSHKGTVLANGGLGGIYQHSTNPSGFNALGSSVALAARSGVDVLDLEYVQFHPTSLNIPNEARFLLTEALRGEGAILRNASGKAFAKDFHVDGELAPRDVVARGVYEESQMSGKVYLDISHRDEDFLYKRFPSIHKHLSQRGLDMARDVLPVIPAAHYTCGGIATNLHGETSLPQLYAAGEAARTGLHGGNRLASTSLLEGLVFGAAVAHAVGNKSSIVNGSSAVNGSHVNGSAINGSHVNGSSAVNGSTNAVKERAASLLKEVRQTMWDHVGVVRTKTGLATAMVDLKQVTEEAQHLYESHPCESTVALRDASHAGFQVAKAALANPVSKGAHYIVEEEDESDEDEDEIMVAEGVQ